MKKIFFITLILTAFISCKSESKTEETTYSEDELTTIKGEFVYFDGAGVLQSNDKIYGVLNSGKLKALVSQADEIKEEPTDMVQVEIKGKVTDQKDDVILWENKVEIVEILKVKPASKAANNIVKIGNE
ncbi:hypothetical protein Q4566_10065 [Tamlana sp. 2_MG-2023]|uniref:hypothetical protein n=1 Tax=unclassified Tamlana TaxID=2614803 RepID=UPI0026E3F121|nr:MULTISPECIES: hypothetical protein [unclassified Tamlana]MDO6760543.1 hypothetical protein [Tamlana sp. 2_MG-2023]MDO6790799.1 hypothetical protein [Tamlana sp. 1_MG-2023]